MPTTDRPSLPAGLADELLCTIGAPLPTDRAGIDRLYAAWVAHVPFDPVAKALARRRGERPPGDDPVEVAERWLATGVGSTCWGHAAVVQALLDRAGVPSTIALDRMLVDRVDFHCFLLLDVDGEQLSLDPVHVSGTLMPFEPGARGTHPAYSVGFDTAGDGRLTHWFVTDDPERPRLTYVVLADGLDLDDARTFLTISTTHSGVGTRFFLRRALADRIDRFSASDDGRTLHHLVQVDAEWEGDDIDDVDEALAATGFHGRAVDHLVEAGLLDPTSPTPWLGLRTPT